MEVITIESKAYGEIMKRLDANSKDVNTIDSKAYNEIINRLDANSKNTITIESRAYREIIRRLDKFAQFMNEHNTDDDWIDDKDICDYLKVSVRTLQRLRTRKAINYTIIGKKAMYKISEVKRALNANLIRCNPQNLQDLLNNFRKDD